MVDGYSPHLFASIVTVERELQFSVRRVRNKAHKYFVDIALLELYLCTPLCTFMAWTWNLPFIALTRRGWWCNPSDWLCCSASSGWSFFWTTLMQKARAWLCVVRKTVDGREVRLVQAWAWEWLCSCVGTNGFGFVRKVIRVSVTEYRQCR